MAKPPLFTIGIDVGGRTKGFHAVALKGGSFYKKFPSLKASEIVKWCCDTIDAQVIAVDAPCAWSLDGHSRPAEQELMQEGIWCFSTPTHQQAKKHHSQYYDWMLRGSELYQLLSAHEYPICTALPLPKKKKQCFETFPHAITCFLKDKVVSAKNKRRDRRELLKQFGVFEPDELTNIDWVDAALCAMTAHIAASGKTCKSFGKASSGFIIVPGEF